MLKIAVLISGRGSNLKAIMDDSKKDKCPYSISVVIADSSCPGLQYAREENIPTYIVNYKDYNSRKDAEVKIHNILTCFDVGLVVLAGYMKLLTSYLITHWENKIINIHPALLPAFPGLHTHERALERGVLFHGCTVHFVDSGMDTGPIILQRVIAVLPIDNAETLADRVLRQEHMALPYVIRRFAADELHVVDKKVIKDYQEQGILV